MSALELPAPITGTTETKRVVCYRILTTPDFRFDIEEHMRGTDQLLFANVHMSRWAPSVYKSWHAVWCAFRGVVTVPIFAVGEVDDRKFERFVRQSGFRLFQEEVMCALGKRRLFVHTVPGDHTGLGSSANESEWDGVCRLYSQGRHSADAR